MEPNLATDLFHLLNVQVSYVLYIFIYRVVGVQTERG